MALNTAERPRSTAEHLRLVVITEGAAAREPDGASRLLAAVEAALRGGATAIMLREKELSVERLARLAADALRLTRAAGAWLIVNHDVDVALAVGADAVHLGWRSESIESVRARVGGLTGRDASLDARPAMAHGLRIGVSTHSPAEVADAARRGADYVTFGPVFPTPSKAGLVAVQGLAGVRDARAAADTMDAMDGMDTMDAANAPGEKRTPEAAAKQRACPLAIVGLGGIDEPRAASVIEAGADGIAIIRAVVSAPDPEAAARHLMVQVTERLETRE